MSKYAYPVDTSMMMSSLKPMPRVQNNTGEKFPRHVVQNSSIGKSGITESSEEQSGSKDGSAELEVLKAILNREGYLNRLKQVARTVGKKFKPEIADVIDFVRAATLDVIEMIIRWREVKVIVQKTLNLQLSLYFDIIHSKLSETMMPLLCGMVSTTC